MPSVRSGKQKSSVEELKADPNRFIEGARRGDLEELYQFAACWSEVPEILTMSPLSVFISHFVRDPEAENAPKHTSLRALYSLRGIAAARDYLMSRDDFVEQIMAALPLILDWIRFFEPMALPLKALIAQDGGDEHYHWSTMIPLNIAALLHCLCVHPVLYRLFASTTGLVDIALKFWLFEEFDTWQDRTLTQHIGPTAALAAYLEFSENTRATVDEILKIEGCDPAKITSLALTRLSTARAVPNHGARMTDTLLDTIQQLSSHPRFSTWFIKNNSVGIISEVLSTLCIRLQKGERDMLHPALLCLGYLSENLERGFEITPPSQAITSGLLWGFVECSPYLDGPMPKGVSSLLVKRIISRTLPTYMTYRSAVQAVYDSTTERLYDFGKIEGSVVKDSWESFLDLAIMRYSQMQGTSLAAVGCDNDLCPQAEGVKYDAKRLRLEERPQVIMQDGSRRTKSLTFSEDGILAMQSLRRRDRAFQYVLTAQDTACKRDFLRTLAAQKYPGVSVTKMVILIDYTVFPPTFSVKHIDEYEFEVVSESITDEIRIARKLGNLRSRPQDGITMIESLIPAGCFNRHVVTTQVKRLWDN